MPTIAITDAGNVLVRFEPCAPEDWIEAEGRVPVPDGCDLLPGRYRRTDGAWLPIIGRTPVTGEPPPDSLLALYHIGKALVAAGTKLDPSVAEWLAAYEVGFDFRGRRGRRG